MPSRISISAKLRKQVAERANHLCEYCKSPQNYSPGPFDTEHITPLSLGGNSDPANLAYACNGCNGHKYNKTTAIDPVEENIVSLYNPRVDKWLDHFCWDEVGTMIIGITPSGRATVDALRLNRAELIRLRELLQIVGEHPPKEN
ncbi:MAG: HNH endonuclease signature motif containing protein [Bacteroidia bacterium]